MLCAADFILCALVLFQGPTNKAFQLQPHPNIDKELLKSRTQIALKNPSKPFPSNTDVGVLKWRFTSQDDSFIPLSSEPHVLSRRIIYSLFIVQLRAFCGILVLK